MLANKNLKNIKNILKLDNILTGGKIMDVKAKFSEAQDYVSKRIFDGALQIYKEIMEATEGEDTYYWALKHYGDVVGYIGYKDYFQSIDVYQKIIMEYENEEDNLYENVPIRHSKSLFRVWFRYDREF